jgi:hypothetical protein
MLPIAAISLAGQVLSRPSSRVHSPGTFHGRGCPAATDGLDEFCSALDNRAAGAWTPAVEPCDCCRSMAARKSPAFRASRPALARPERRASDSDGLGAEAAARAAPWGRLETVQKVLTRMNGFNCPTPTDR